MGKAGFKRNGTNLRKRILEELKDERAFVWRALFSEAALQKMIRKMSEGKYNGIRSMRKAGSTAIIWVPVPEIPESDILQIESNLIEALNPLANQSRPTPKNTAQETAENVLIRFRRLIHENRPDRASNEHNDICRQLKGIWKSLELRPLLKI